MLELTANRARAKPLRVLCIGAHCDDIEIGCGGTLLTLQQRTRSLRVDYAILSGSAEREQEARKALALLVRPKSVASLRFAAFRDGHFPAQYGEVKAFVESLKQLPRPDVVLCHERDDRHQDHRLVNEMVWNTFRNHLVLEYEIPKWDGGLGTPNLYVPVTKQHATKKVRSLLAAYRSQAKRDWFTEETLMAMLRLRGIECRSPSGLAEAFYARKLLVSSL